jgi:hypothetical protein
MALLVFLALANLVVVQYGRGALRSALEQGARVGAVSGSLVECEARARDVLAELMGGRMSEGLALACATDGERVVAEASVTFESWTVLAPDFDVSMSSEAVVEPLP